MTPEAPESQAASFTLDEFVSDALEYERSECRKDELCAALNGALRAKTDEKGDALEDFVAKAFSCHSRLFHDEKKRRRYLERDRVLTIRTVPGTLVASWGNHELVVDARNRKETYGAGDAAECLERLRESRSALGLIVAAAGISTQGGASARRVLQRAWDAEGIVVGVISGDDLLAWCSEDEGSGRSWLELVHESIISARHGPPYRS